MIDESIERAHASKDEYVDVRTTDRIDLLRRRLIQKGFENRSREWFDKDKLPDIGKLSPEALKARLAELLTARALACVENLGVETHVMVRRAIAINDMLVSMTSKPVCIESNCHIIDNNELLCGTIPMGSNGLGKVFPNYLTEEELRVGSVTNKSQMALLGHNTINYDNLVKNGLNAIIEKAENKLLLRTGLGDAYSKAAFSVAVIISCKAVINFAKYFAALARSEAKQHHDGKRHDELLRMAKICDRMPAEPAKDFYEALQSIWFVHCCLHSTMDYFSLGRLDQVLNPFVAKNKDSKDYRLQVELVENFILKAAGRLNLTTQYLVEQDHMDYNAALGIHPYYLDQRAGLNNFLQNVIIGGVLPSGKDAINDCSFLILNAFKNVNLPTPGLYVRLHKGSNKKFVKAVADCIKQTKNIPYILNDEVMVPAMVKALVDNEDIEKAITDKVMEPLTGKEITDKYLPTEAYDQNMIVAQKIEDARDYCVDGCWEPILNGKSEWTFGMVNGMTILECALNRGATLSSNPALLRGQKLSIDTGKLETFEDLEKALEKQMGFFVDQSVLAMCLYYLTTEFVVPSPLVSALFSTCLEQCLDKSWGGAEYNLAGTVLGGAPDMINTLCAFKKFVFGTTKEAKNTYSLQDVTNAMRYNFTAGPTDYKTQRLYDRIKVDFFTNTPQFGNDPECDEIAQLVLDKFYNACKKAKELAIATFIDSKGDKDPKIIAQRAIAGYYGDSLEQIFLDQGVQFDLKFTCGLGTFEQYNWQGAGIAASVGRNVGDPLAPNFTPTSGTWHTPPTQLLETFDKLGLNRFAAGVITDICLPNAGMVDTVIDTFVEKNGGMLTVTIASEKYDEIYEIAKAANEIGNKHAASDKLMQYADIMVRVGGWNAPFITLPLSHMENYLKRPVASN